MELLTKKELSEKLKVSEVTINRMLADGMPKIKIRSNIRFDIISVMDWVKERYNGRTSNV